MRPRSTLSALLALAALLPEAAAAQPAVQYDGQGRPIARFEQTPGGGTVQEDWRGRTEGSMVNTPVGPVFQDWRGIPEGSK